MVVPEFGNVLCMNPNGRPMIRVLIHQDFLIRQEQMVEPISHGCVGIRSRSEHVTGTDVDSFIHKHPDSPDVIPYGCGNCRLESLFRLEIWGSWYGHSVIVDG